MFALHQATSMTTADSGWGYYIDIDSQSDSDSDSYAIRERSVFESNGDDSPTHTEVPHAERAYVAQEPQACASACPDTCMQRNVSSGTYIGDMLVDAVVQECLLSENCAETKATDVTASGSQRPAPLYCWIDWSWLRRNWCPF